MKNKMKILTLMLLSSSAFSASLENAQYFSSSERFYSALSSLKNANSNVIAGPFIDAKTKEEFIVLEDESEKCRLVTKSKSSKINCGKAIDQRMLIGAGQLENSIPANNNTFNELLDLNGKMLVREKSFPIRFATGVEQTYSFNSTLKFDFSPDLKSVRLDSMSHINAGSMTSTPRLRIKSIQKRINQDQSEDIILCVDRNESFYSQSSDKGALNTINPEYFKAKEVEELMHVVRNDSGQIAGVGGSSKKGDTILMVDFNFMIIKKSADGGEVQIDLLQSLEMKKDLTVSYSIK